MPLYDYRCTTCNHHFELLVRSPTLPACPACSSQQLEKQVACPAPQGQTGAILSRARAQAAREGHFSNYKLSERKKK